MDRPPNDTPEQGPSEDEARDRPRASEDWGTTAAEQRDEESLGDRLDEELPGGEPGARRRAARIMDEGPVDSEADLVGEAGEDDEYGLSAEEAAIRVDETPGGLTDHPDDYVGDEG